MILKLFQNPINSIKMISYEESDYGFFCDIEQELYNVYPKQSIGISNLHTILEDNQKSTSSIKLTYDNLKHEIYNINIGSVLAYIFVSIGSMYVTTKLFYKYNP